MNSYTFLKVQKIFYATIAVLVGIKQFYEDGRVLAAAEPTRRGGGSAIALDVEDIDPPQEISISSMKTLVERYEEEGDIANHETAQLLQTHLTTVGHYEERE